MALTQAFQNAETLTYQKTDDARYECLVCPHRCKLRNGQRGICQVREAENGIFLRGYGKITHAAVEPIEKKPIYHFKPNTKTLSIGGYGCSMACSYCQNWMVSQEDKFETATDLSPMAAVKLAESKNCKAICFTYNEPIVYYEYIVDLAKQCQESNLDLILKTNAYAEIPIWEVLCSVSSAMNIDWKGSQERYQKVARADQQPVLDCIKYAINKTHVEISIPVYHDSTILEHEEFARFMSENPYVPLHLLKIYPAYKDVGCQVTSDGLVHRVAKLYSAHSKFVYVQNVYDQKGLQDTRCPSCKATIASRQSLETVVHGDSCCGCPIIVV